jgi:hypothetical protein
MTSRPDQSQTCPPFHQLALPFPDPLRRPPRLPTDTPLLSPPQVWGQLALAQQAQVRQAFLGVFREVRHERLAR